MRFDKLVYVEMDDGNAPIKIFKNLKSAQATGVRIGMCLYKVAVYRIRRAVFVRSGGDCELCGSPVTESGGQMHEKKWRGRGGEISLENSLFICAKCHQNAHKERNPRWKKNRSGAERQET